MIPLPSSFIGHEASLQFDERSVFLLNFLAVVLAFPYRNRG